MPEEREEREPGKGRFLWGCLVFLAIPPSIGILAFAYENWSGAREWERVREKLTAAGVTLDPGTLVREMPPAGENYASAPMIRALATYEVDGEGEVVFLEPERVERFREIRIPASVPAGEGNRWLPNWKNGNRVDLVGLAEGMTGKPGAGLTGAEAAARLLEDLKRFDGDFAELEAASERPEAVLPPTLGTSFPESLILPVPYATDSIRHQRLLLVRCLAALEAGDSAMARRSLRLMYQTARWSGSQPLLICHLVENTNWNLLLSAVWQGLEAGRWTESDLAWIGELLSGTPDAYLERSERAIHFELCVGPVAACDFLKTPAAMGLGNFLPDGGAETPFEWAGWIRFFFPEGIWDHNKAFSAEYLYEHGIRAVRERRLPSPGADLAELTKGWSLRRIIPAIMLPAIDDVIARSFETAAALDLARVACAAERFRLVRGRFPGAAGELVPEFLDEIPADLFSAAGDRLRVVRKGARCRVYSVGVNGTDEGGAVVFENSNRRKRVSEQGDLAWGYDYGGDPVK